MHVWTLGVDGQFVINDDWNLVAGVEYSGLSDSWADNEGEWDGYFGVNYNIDSTKYIGAYVAGEMSHKTGDWKWHEGMGFGVKFGVDF